VELEEHVAVEMGEDVVEIDLDLSRPPERRLRDRGVGAKISFWTQRGIAVYFPNSYARRV
jgi:hypothetical protein